VGTYTVNLHFDRDDLSICDASTFVRKSDGLESLTFTTAPSAAASLVQLLDLPVRVARREPPGTLVLDFDGGESLALPDAEENYESYTIRIGGDLYVI